MIIGYCGKARASRYHIAGSVAAVVVIGLANPIASAAIVLRGSNTLYSPGSAKSVYTRAGTGPFFISIGRVAGGGLPPQVTLISPANGATSVSFTPTLSWNASSGATAYDVYFGTSPTPPLVTSISGTTYNPAALSCGTTYYWNIVAKNGFGAAPPSVTFSFATIGTPPQAVLSSPVNGASNVSTTPLLLWNAALDATSYDVYFGTAASPPFVGNVVGTSYSPGSLAFLTGYFWKIVAKNSCGSAAASVVFSFTTQAVPAPNDGIYLSITEPVIGLTDRSGYVWETRPQTIDLQRGTRGVSTVTLCTLPGDTYRPVVGSPIYWYERVASVITCIFAGTIDHIAIHWSGQDGLLEITLSCVSLEQCFDTLRPTPRAYFNKTWAFIINDLLNDTCIGIPVTPGTISTGSSVASLILIGDRTVTDILNQAATESGFIWFVRMSDQTLQFHVETTEAAPVTLVGGLVLWDTLQWETDRANYRNRQIVQGSFAMAAPSAVLFTGDSVTKSFTTPWLIDSLVSAQWTNATQARLELHVVIMPIVGDTFTIALSPDAAQIYTFVSTLDNTKPNQVLIPPLDPGGLALRMSYAINANPAYTGIYFSLPTMENRACNAVFGGVNVVTLIAKVPGSGGNTLTFSSTAAGLTRSTVFLKPYIIQASYCGSTDSANFPIMIGDLQAYLKSVANGGHVQSDSGFDITFFADAACTIALSWEMEFYDPTTGEFLAWVKIPNLSHTANTTIYALYGSTGVTSFQGGGLGAAWDSNYSFVCHLAVNAPTGTPTPNLTDSTQNRFDGIPAGSTAPAYANFIIGGGAHFDGAVSRVLMNGSIMSQSQGGSTFFGFGRSAFAFAAPNAGGLNVFTVEAWVRPTTVSAGKHTIFASGPSSCQVTLSRNGSDYIVEMTGSISFSATDTGGAAAGVGAHVAATWDGTNLKIYRNGALKATGAAASTLSPGGATNSIGNAEFLAGQYFDGDIDEVRVSRVARSIDYLLATYNNGNTLFADTMVDNAQAEQAAPVKLAALDPTSILPLSIGTDVTAVRGSTTVSCATPPPTGASLAVQYRRLGQDCVVVEDTSQVVVRAGVEHGTGKYQSFLSDAQNTDEAAVLAKAQKAESTYGQLPAIAGFQTDQPLLSPGQYLVINVALPIYAPALVNGSWRIQQVRATLVSGMVHFRYTVTVTSSIVPSSLQFWTQLFLGQ